MTDYDPNRPLSQPEPKGMGLATGGLGAAGAFVGLVIFALFVALFCAAAGFASAIAITIIARVFGWPREWRFFAVWRACFLALVVHQLITLGLDLLFHTYFSVFSMVAALNKLECAPLCFSILPGTRLYLIRSVKDYYDIGVGHGAWAWTKYGLAQLPGVIGAMIVIQRTLPVDWEARGSIRRIFLAAAAAIAISLFVALPWLIHGLLSFRGPGS